MILFFGVIKSAVKIERVFRIGQFSLNFGLLMGEAVGDVFQKNEAEYDVFVIGGIKLLAQLIGR